MEKFNVKYGMFNQNLMTMFDKIDTANRYRCLSTAGLAIGSSSKKAILIANTVNFLFNGQFGAKTTAEVAFTATTHDIAASAAAVQEAMYLLSFSAIAGTPVITMGTVASGAGNAVLPEVPAGHTPVGAVRIAIAAGTTIFNATTDDLDAAHITDTYYNFGWLAPRFDAIV